MVVIPPGGSFVSRGAIVPTEEELNVIIHAIMAGRADIIENGGASYGPTMTTERLGDLISSLEEYRRVRGA